MNGNVFNYTAEGAIPPFRIAAFGEANDKRALSGATETPAGITTDVGCSAVGDRIDVQEDGEARLELGGGVAAGDWLASDVLGRGAKAAAGAKVIAQAKESGSEKEIIRVNITKFQLGG
jgi:hypothetical protein